MLTAVLDRMPDYVCDPEGTEHYETIGVIQGMKHLPATFTPSKPLGPGLDETLEEAATHLRRAIACQAHHRTQGRRRNRVMPTKIGGQVV